MFLSNLSAEEKRLFLQASLHLSSADGQFSDDERIVIKQLCMEMELPLCFDITMPLSEVIKRFSEESGVKARKILVFELSGIVMADGKYHDSEKQLMEQYCEALKLPVQYAEQCMELIGKIAALYKEASGLVI